MHYFHAKISIACLAWTTLLTCHALGQSAAQQPAGVQPVPAASSAPPSGTPNTTPPQAVTTTAMSPAVTAPTPAAATYATPPATYPVPQGYMLIPIGSSSAADEALIERQRELAKEHEEEVIEAWEPGEEVPEGYRVVRKSRRGLVIAGSIVGGIAYGGSLVAATAADYEDESVALMVPVAGPWIMLALGGAKNRTCTESELSDYLRRDHCGDRSGARAALALDGLMQVAGAAMLTIGIAYPSTRLVRKGLQVSMAPVSFGHDGYGVGAIGSF